MSEKEGASLDRHLTQEIQERSLESKLTVLRSFRASKTSPILSGVEGGIWRLGRGTSGTDAPVVKPWGQPVPVVGKYEIRQVSTLEQVVALLRLLDVAMLR